MEGKKTSLETESVDFRAVVNFLSTMLEKRSTLINHLDTQINLLIGINSAIFIFSLSRFLDDKGDLPMLVISFFAGLSTLIALVAVHPPKLTRKRGQEESLMYNKKILSFPSSSKYEKELFDAVSDKKKIVNQYALEIYNITKYYYRPKRGLFNLAR